MFCQSSKGVPWFCQSSKGVHLDFANPQRGCPDFDNPWRGYPDFENPRRRVTKFCQSSKGVPRFWQFFEGGAQILPIMERHPVDFFFLNHYAPVRQANWCNMTFTAGNLFPSHSCIVWPESSPHWDSNPAWEADDLPSEISLSHPDFANPRKGYLNFANH